jgi:hypothetical protein
LENGKPLFQPKSAQPRARARAPSTPDRRTPPVGASSRAPSLPLSLSLLCGAGLSAPIPSRTCSLFLYPANPTRQTPSLTSCPRPRRGRAHICAFSGHHSMLSAPLEPAPRSPSSPCSFAPFVELSRPLSRPARAPGSSATAHRHLPPVLRSSWDSPPRLLPQ